MKADSKTFERVIYVESAEETKLLGKSVGALLKGGEVILMTGSLGAGKTTMVQGIALGLGVREAVKSPSFVLERIYHGRLKLHHFDFYRLTGEDVFESGLLYDIEKSAVVAVEWPERAENALHNWTLAINLEFCLGPKGTEFNKRKITLKSGNPSWEKAMGSIWRHNSGNQGIGGRIEH